MDDFNFIYLGLNGVEEETNYFVGKWHTKMDSLYLNEEVCDSSTTISNVSICNDRNQQYVPFIYKYELKDNTETNFQGDYELILTWEDGCYQDLFWKLFD